MTDRPPLEPHGVHVTKVYSNGFTVFAHVTIDIVPGTAIVVRHIRASRDGFGQWHLAAPNVLVGDNAFVAAVTIPPTWRPKILDAILEAARRSGIVPRQAA